MKDCEYGVKEGIALTLSTEVLKPMGSVEAPVLNGTLGSPLKVPVLSSPGLTGFLGCVLEDSWVVREDIVNVAVWFVDNLVDAEEGFDAISILG